MSNRHSMPAPLKPDNPQELLERAQQELGDKFPEEPMVKYSRHPQGWKVVVFPAKRGDKQGGYIVVSDADASVLEKVFHQ